MGPLALATRHRCRLVQNDHYFQESLGVYSILFLTGNFPNPMVVPTN